MLINFSSENSWILSVPSTNGTRKSKVKISFNNEAKMFELATDTAIIKISKESLESNARAFNGTIVYTKKTIDAQPEKTVDARIEIRNKKVLHIYPDPERVRVGSWTLKRESRPLFNKIKGLIIP